MQNKTKIKWLIIAFFYGWVILSSNFAMAQSSESGTGVYEKFGISNEQFEQMTPEEKMKVEQVAKAFAESNVIKVASVNIYEATVINQTKNDFRLAFEVHNGEGYQYGIKYAVQLIRTGGGNRDVVMDEKVYSESFNLGENKKIKKEIGYVAPPYLNGEYTLKIVTRNDAGLSLGMANLGKVVLGGTGQYVEIVTDSCFLQVDDEAGDIKYDLSQGVDIGKDEQLLGKCKVKNNFQQEIVVTPNFQTFYRTSFGEKIVTEEIKADPIVLGPQEERNIEVMLPKASQPQAYDARLELLNNQNQISSNAVTFHYVLRGESATIQNLTTDKETYAHGDTAKLSVFWSPSADNFPEARVKQARQVGKATMEVIMQNEEGKNCASPLVQEISKMDEFSLVALPIESDCAIPHTIVVIKDSAGGILSSKIFVANGDVAVAPELKKEKSWQDYGNWLVVIVIIVLIVAVLVVYKIRMGGRVLGIIIFLIVASLFCAADYARADTFVITNNDGWHLFTININLNKEKYSANEDIYAAVEIVRTYCTNAVIYSPIDLIWMGDFLYGSLGCKGWIGGGCLGAYYHNFPSANVKLGKAITCPKSRGKPVILFEILPEGGNYSHIGNIEYKLDHTPNPPSAPIITGPTTVKVKEVGKWPIVAINPTGGNINYELWFGPGAWGRISGAASGVPQEISAMWPTGGNKAIRAWAANQCGDSSASVDYAVEVIETAPTNLVVTPVSCDRVDLAWVDNSDDEDGFKIERRDMTTLGQWMEIAIVGSNSGTYQDTGLVANNKYRYRVYAYKGSDISNYTNRPDATTLSVCNQSPVASITSPAADITVNEGSAVVFAGTGTDADGTISGYEWRDGSCTAGSILATAETFNKNDLSVGVHDIYFRVQDDVGAWSACDTRKVTVVACTFSNYQCVENSSIECAVPTNCALPVSIEAHCMATNDCSGSTVEKNLTDCIAKGISCADSTDTCPVCKPNTNWREVRP